MDLISTVPPTAPHREIISYAMLSYSFHACGKCSTSKPCVQREQFNCQAGGCQWEMCVCPLCFQPACKKGSLFFWPSGKCPQRNDGGGRVMGAAEWEVNSWFPLGWLVCLEYKIPKKPQKLFWHQDPELTDVYSCWGAAFCFLCECTMTLWNCHVLGAGRMGDFSAAWGDCIHLIFHFCFWEEWRCLSVLTVWVILWIETVCFNSDEIQNFNSSV